MNTLLELFPTWAGKDRRAIAEDCKRIDESYHRAVYTLKGNQLPPFFGNQQRMVMRWLDQGYEKKVKDGLLAVWDNLYGQFGNYLNHRLPLAQPVLSRERERNAELFAPVEAQLVDNGLTPGLVGILAGAFDFHDLPNGEEVPLAKLAYLRKLFPLLARICNACESHTHCKCARAGSESMESHLIRLLILHNFNSFDFYWHCTREIDRQVSLDLPLMEQLGAYQAWLTELARHPQQTNTAFVAGLPGIRGELEGHVRNEIRKRKGLLKVTENLQSAGLLKVRAQWTLSAAQLALFCRVLVNKGVLVLDGDQQFFEFIHAHVSTPKTEHPSEKAFGNNFYTYPGHHDAKVVHKLLNELAEYVRVEYGVAV